MLIILTNQITPLMRISKEENRSFQHSVGHWVEMEVPFSLKTCGGSRWTSPNNFIALG